MERSTIVSTIILPQIDYLYVVVLLSSSYEYIKLYNSHFYRRFLRLPPLHAKDFLQWTTM